MIDRDDVQPADDEMPHGTLEGQHPPISRDSDLRGRPPGSEYEDPATALSPSAGPGAGGPGGTGRSDMRDVGDRGSGAPSGYGTPDGEPVDEPPETGRSSLS